MVNKDFNCHCPHLDVLTRDQEEHFTSIGQSFVQVNERFEGMDKRFDKVEQWLEQIARNMALLLDMHGIHEASLNYNSRMISNHESRIGKLERRAS